MENIAVKELDDPEAISLYATCSHCGHQLGQYVPPCRRHTTTCPKCGSRLAIAAKDSRIMIDVLATKEKRLQHLRTTA